jgi:hypothetical protein
MKRVLGLLAIAAFSVAMVPLVQAKPEYAKKEGKTCTECHVHGNPKKLTDMGKYYQDHDHSLKGYEAPK